MHYISIIFFIEKNWGGGKTQITSVSVCSNGSQWLELGVGEHLRSLGTWPHAERGRGGGRERHSDYLRSAEALSEKRKRRERKQRRSPTALTPHCQETGLGLDRVGWGGVRRGRGGVVFGGGGGGGGRKGEGDQNTAGVHRLHVMCQHGPSAERAKTRGEFSIRLQ